MIDLEVLVLFPGFLILCKRALGFHLIQFLMLYWYRYCFLFHIHSIHFYIHLPLIIYPPGSLIRHPTLLINLLRTHSTRR